MAPRRKAIARVKNPTVSGRNSIISPNRPRRSTRIAACNSSDQSHTEASTASPGPRRSSRLRARTNGNGVDGAKFEMLSPRSESVESPTFVVDPQEDHSELSEFSVTSDHSSDDSIARTSREANGQEMAAVVPMSRWQHWWLRLTGSPEPMLTGSSHNAAEQTPATSGISENQEDDEAGDPDAVPPFSVRSPAPPGVPSSGGRTPRTRSTASTPQGLHTRRSPLFVESGPGPDARKIPRPLDVPGSPWFMFPEEAVWSPCAVDDFADPPSPVPSGPRANDFVHERWDITALNVYFGKPETFELVAPHRLQLDERPVLREALTCSPMWMDPYYVGSHADIPVRQNMFPRRFWTSYMTASGLWRHVEITHVMRGVASRLEASDYTRTIIRMRANHVGALSWHNMTPNEIRIQNAFSAGLNTPIRRMNNTKSWDSFMEDIFEDALVIDHA
ncbi:hypothetical protein CAC42_2443 [Sphaceloma murrayae]|uniref:Uncharacterized protein n=1 Tax=Sphaceloma murrayae TaxID=2082308 RepID=A0A2K1QW38_9PEZI|nr:hypothetical protein CAC42_2443 [Sphaceloma murrayae]